jgi:2-isopropylmalate synthase
MKNYDKYEPGYFMPPKESVEWVNKERVTSAPIWCSVDLRDGNQALIVPMSLDEKIEYFKLLTDIGFKEIEVGFPASSETEFSFLRTLVEENMIPDDVTIQVLTQSRKHIIKKTFESLKGVKKAVVHLYNSTSLAQREQVFKMSQDEIIAIAKNGASLFNKYAARMPETDFAFQYSPESFTGTEIDFALRICNEVIDIWEPSPERRVIINLPATVAMSMPHVHASQIEFMSKNLNKREHVILSLHPHNDRGTAVADAELGLLAGADRIEGTLFGNGERTGNVDIVTLAMNLFSHGVNPNLDFSSMPEIVKKYERLTDLPVHARQPYGGKLVFAAFSGSHQDAIAKGMKFRKKHKRHRWDIPYLLIDPQDIGREYEADVIRINSQSGKGGIAYILEQNYGYDIPDKMREEVGYFVKNVSDHEHAELPPNEVLAIFENEYINRSEAITITDAGFRKEGLSQGDNGIQVDIEGVISGEKISLSGVGNGRLDAVSNALKSSLHISDYKFLAYSQHALEADSHARAAAYVALSDNENNIFWGVGLHEDIVTASIKALVSAISRQNSAGN